MTEQELCNPRTRSRKLWDRHGSWLVLAFVVALAFNAGQEVEGYKRNAIIKQIVDAGVVERDTLRARIRFLSDKNFELSGKIQPTLEKADEAVKKADTVLQKTEKVIEGAK
jgi:hypothetical protein